MYVPQRFVRARATSLATSLKQNIMLASGFQPDPTGNSRKLSGGTMARMCAKCLSYMSTEGIWTAGNRSR
ncbi:uncharacterized protein PG986_015026 [Apiospora aurea]|uniref:Uncharacterized protein n=1 Tax=Apiospora aurea TaxID=335848 RepID=A0ABR1PRE8_9PEZI